MLNTDARQQLRKLLPLEMVATKQWLLDQGLSLHFWTMPCAAQPYCRLPPGCIAC